MYIELTGNLIKFYKPRIDFNCNQQIGFGCFCGVFGGCGTAGGIYFIMDPIYNTVSCCGPRLHVTMRQLAVYHEVAYNGVCQKLKVQLNEQL